MLVTMGAKRSAQYGDVDGTTGYERKVEVSTDDNTVTELDNSRDAMRLVEDVTRMLRMSHVFFWAIHPVGSDTLGVVPSYDGTDDFDVSRLGPMLVSDEGLKSLVKYGQLTEPEMKALVATGLPPSQYPYVLLEWAGIRCIDGMQDGTLRATPGMEENIIRQFTKLRAEYFSIGDFTAGRMPMAYVSDLYCIARCLLHMILLETHPRKN